MKTRGRECADHHGTCRARPHLSGACISAFCTRPVPDPWLGKPGLFPDPYPFPSRCLHEPPANLPRPSVLSLCSSISWTWPERHYYFGTWQFFFFIKTRLRGQTHLGVAKLGFFTTGFLRAVHILICIWNPQGEWLGSCRSTSEYRPDFVDEWDCCSVEHPSENSALRFLLYLCLPCFNTPFSIMFIYFISSVKSAVSQSWGSCFFMPHKAWHTWPLLAHSTVSNKKWTTTYRALTICTALFIAFQGMPNYAFWIFFRNQHMFIWCFRNFVVLLNKIFYLSFTTLWWS